MATIQRSTKKNASGGYVYLDTKQNRILTADELDASAASSLLAKLARYEDLQESGRLHCFPCNPGEKIFVRATFNSQSGAVVVSAIEAVAKRFIYTEDNKLLIIASFDDGTEAELAQGEFYTSKKSAVEGTKAAE